MHPGRAGTWPGCSRRIDAWPVNVVLLGKGNTVVGGALWEQLRAGAAGFKLHEDWGTTPAAIDACLRVSTAAGVQAAIHTDTLNEAGFVEATLAAIGGRPIHAYHTEGAGGGHAPDIIRSPRRPTCCRPRPTRPGRTRVNTIAEHLDMLMVCHHLNPSVPEDLAFAESRIRPSTIAAEDVLHDLGAISMIGSDSQAMGRIGEVDHAHLADRARDEAAARRSRLRHVAATTGRAALTTRAPGATSPSTRSARRSPTASTAEIGSVEPGKLADLVLWEPAFFGVRPHVVHQGRRRSPGPRWATRTPRSRPRSRCCRGRCSAPTAGVPATTSLSFVAAGRARRRACRAAGPDRATWSRSPTSPRLRQGRPAQQRRAAGHPRRPRHASRSASTARWSRPSPATRAADGAALLPVLMTAALPGRPASTSLLLADCRLPAGAHAHSGGLEAR